MLCQNCLSCFIFGTTRGRVPALLANQSELGGQNVRFLIETRYNRIGNWVSGLLFFGVCWNLFLVFRTKRGKDPIGMLERDRLWMGGEGEGVCVGVGVGGGRVGQDGIVRRELF